MNPDELVASMPHARALSVRITAAGPDEVRGTSTGPPSCAPRAGCCTAGP
jgi:hypothetical protein